MRIILEIASIDSRDAVEDMTKYVDVLKREIERRQHQGMPGAWVSLGDGGVWIRSVKLDA